jgi:hypothetical protein
MNLVISCMKVKWADNEYQCVSQESERGLGLGVHEMVEQKGVKSSESVSVKHGVFYKAAYMRHDEIETASRVRLNVIEVIDSVLSAVRGPINV